MQTVSFRAPSEKIASLDQLAASHQRDRTFLINEAIDHYLALQEHRDQLTREALASIDAGLTVNQENVEAWAMSLGSENPLPVPKASHRLKG
jgi:predicted transcriptional regulator